MKLSEAIRLGSMLSTPCVGLYTNNGGRCAIGAAYEGAIGDLAKLSSPCDAYDILRNMFPILQKRVKYSIKLVNLLYPFTLEASLFDAIYRLNDTLTLNREEIADWVEYQENIDEIQHQTKEVVEVKEKVLA